MMNNCIRILGNGCFIGKNLPIESMDMESEYDNETPTQTFIVRLTLDEKDSYLIKHFNIHELADCNAWICYLNYVYELRKLCDVSVDTIVECCGTSVGIVSYTHTSFEVTLKFAEAIVKGPNISSNTNLTKFREDTKENLEQGEKDKMDNKLVETKESKKEKEIELEISNIDYNVDKGMVVVVFKDGVKVIKNVCQGDNFDLNVGVALAIADKLYGSKTQFHKAVTTLKENLEAKNERKKLAKLKKKVLQQEIETIEKKLSEPVLPVIETNEE